MELLGGQLYERARIGTSHLIAVTRLQQAFSQLNAQLRLLVQQPVIVDNFNEPQPDVYALREPLRGRKPEARDCLVVIEVYDRVPGLDERGGTHYRPGQQTPAVGGISIDVAALLADLPPDD